MGNRLLAFALSAIGIVGIDCGAAIAGSAAPSWTGFYAGISFGQRWDRADWTTDGFIIPGTPGVSSLFPDTEASLGAARARLGGYFGYNYQINNWVLGAEADIGRALRDSKSVIGIPGTGTGIALVAGTNLSQTTIDMTWDGSLRARAGYLVAPDVLVYGTGGIAFQHVGETILCSAFDPAPTGCGLAGSPDVGSAVNTTLTGWTVGGGIEERLGRHWMLRGEYRYSDFGTFNHTFALGPTAIGDVVATTRFTTHLVTLGLAYKFGAPAAIDDPPAEMRVKARAVAPSWTGFHVGLALGARRTTADWITTSLTFGGIPNADNVASFDGIRFRGGGYAGYDHQLGRMVLGFEVGAGTTDNGAKSKPGVPGLGGMIVPGPDMTSVRTGWDASAVVRIGYLVAPDVLLYGTGGIAAQRITLNALCTAASLECFFDENESFSTTRSGPVWGGGIEAMIARHWQVRMDYRIADFGNVDHTFFVAEPFQSPTTTTAIRTQTATVGIAYRFGPEP